MIGVFLVFISWFYYFDVVSIYLLFCLLLSIEFLLMIILYTLFLFVLFIWLFDCLLFLLWVFIWIVVKVLWVRVMGYGQGSMLSCCQGSGHLSWIWVVIGHLSCYLGLVVMSCGIVAWRVLRYCRYWFWFVWEWFF